ncbi:hypothetical protein EJ06DRAFT_91696 [Trichodelitschia bisporula]|uniref:Serine/threonine-protein kinase Tel1 n=1 Tax=Trichodelitschia bisporula TaxID=703511 RepID=A0A6G1HS04_9PEZI|nr:hypothetical protein EJ06DRAFT_91696 [Trichodelitschia bisporula]
MADDSLELGEILNSVRSNSATERNNGLNKLNDLFRNIPKASLPEVFREKTAASIFEALYTYTAQFKGAKGISNANAIRIGACASTLRTVVTAGVQNIPWKVLKPLLNHIMEMWTPEASLRIDYVKALRILLEYQPHAEHLGDRWHRLVDFCIDGLDLMLDHTDQKVEDAVRPKTHRTASTPIASGSRSTPKLVTRDSRGRPSMEKRAEVEELIICLRQLTRASNAPIGDRAESLLTLLVRFLRSSDAVSRAHHYAFLTINAVLSTTANTSIELTTKFTLEVLPLAKDLWSTKASDLKDEITVLLLLTQAQIAHLAAGPAWEALETDVEGLLDVLQNEYSKRSERDQLSLGDLGLTCRLLPNPDTPLSANGFYLQNGKIHAEHSWATLHLVAFYSHLLDCKKREEASLRAQKNSEQRKRQRISLLYQEYLRQASSGSGASSIPGQICALQTLAFMSRFTSFAESELDAILETLSKLVVDPHSSISSWAMMTILGCAHLKSAQSPSLRETWKKVSELGTRNLTSPLRSRVACHLLNTLFTLSLVSFESMATELEPVFSSVELNGPAAISDSSTSLWVTLIDLQASESPTSTGDIYERLVRWVFAKWVPSKFDDKSYAAQMSSTCRPSDLILLLNACSNRPNPQPKVTRFQYHGRVAQTFQHVKDWSGLSQYLLLVESNPLGHIQSVAGDAPDNDAATRTGRSRMPVDTLIIDSCLSETEMVTEKWIEWTDERGQSIMPDMIRLVASLCILNDIVTTWPSNTSVVKRDALRRANDSLIQSLNSFLSKPECEKEKIDCILELTADHLPDISQLKTAEGNPIPLAFVVQISKTLEARRKLQASASFHERDDFMEVDDEFETQSSNSNSKDNDMLAARDKLGAASDINAFRACISGYIHLVSCATQTMDTDQAAPTVPSGVVARMMSLSPSELCACRLLFLEILQSLSLTATDAASLLDHASAEFLEVYAYERHEVALMLALDILGAYMEQWSDAEAENVRKLAVEMYDWFILIALPRHICSINVQLSIMELLLSLLASYDAEYAPSPRAPSVETSLFGLLKSGSIPLKFRIAERLSEYFAQLPLGRHEAAFENVHKSIPEELDSKEGLALRLYVLARLGASWSTLVRRCVYHIFETAGLVPHAQGHALHCVSIISEVLGLDPQALFRLFAPQILYSWLDNQPLSAIPFEIFKYYSLAQLLEDVKDEAFGQLLMKTRQDELDFLVESLGSSTVDILCDSFGKATAYCLARAAEHSDSRGLSSGEGQIRKLLGAAKYKTLLNKFFPTIIGTFMATIEEESRLPKALSKDPDSSDAGTLLTEMISISASDITLPSDQQPLFRAKYLLPMIQQLCEDSQRDYGSLWTPALYVLVLRMMLNRIHPALGSLHACSMIRKIRVLIALAGPVALANYQLEMTLHALRPFLTDNHCADDAIGVSQYLFVRGLPYLTNQMAFVSGVVVSTLVSLRRFTGSSQDKTTQQDQHAKTMTTAQKFHEWLVDEWSTDYSKSYQKKGLDASTLGRFRSLLEAAANTQAKSSAIERVAESRLLKELLEDQKVGTCLLDGPARDLTLGLLSSQFEKPPSYRNDILGRDTEALSLAPEVYSSCGSPNVGENYLLWAARVLGRAYNRNGWSERLITRSDTKPQVEEGPQSHRWSSEKVIIHALRDLLMSSELSEVGLAEEALRLIGSLTTEKEEARDFFALLPDSMQASLSLPRTEVRLTPRPSVPLPLEEILASYDMPYDVWIRNLTVALILTCRSDPLIGSLDCAIAGIRGLAEKLFAPIWHLVLLRDVQAACKLQRTLSDACKTWFLKVERTTIPHVRSLLNVILYLRKQIFPRESVVIDRFRWVEVDFTAAARAAETCGMHTTALMLVEIGASDMPTSSRPSSTVTVKPLPDDLLLSIYRNIAEPDSFYGVQQSPTLDSVINRLEYESDGFKGLLFRGARLDSQMRNHHEASSVDFGGVVRSMINLNLNSVTHALLSNRRIFDRDAGSVDSVLRTAQKLEQWDIRVPETAKSETATTFMVFQGIHNAPNSEIMRKRLDTGFLTTIHKVLSPDTARNSLKRSLRTLGLLTEIDDVLSSSSPDQLQDAIVNMQERNTWILHTQPDDAMPILSARETLFSTLSTNKTLQDLMHINGRDARNFEIQNLIASCAISRRQGALQESLAVATKMIDLLPVYKELGLDIEAEVEQEVADVLWDQGEQSTSIRKLQQLITHHASQKVKTSDNKRANLLAKLGHHIAAARLEQPDEIMSKYLGPAIEQLLSKDHDSVAARVFHEFATFCDKQLQNPDGVEEFNRIQRLRDWKKKEMDQAKASARSSRTEADKKGAQYEYVKADKWFRIYNEEYQRMHQIRETSMIRSLENYLLCLTASDEYDNDILRFLSLWLEYADSETANAAVGRHLLQVPTAKFVRLTNQLSSRLQADRNEFQSHLFKLIGKMCADHPYHMMHHIFAIMTSEHKDGTGKLRWNAANQISSSLKKDKTTHVVWQAIYETDKMYHELALYGTEKGKSFECGKEFRLDQFPVTKNMARKIRGFEVPPATMSIPLQANMNYSNVPRIVGFKSKMRIANGLSMPKILTAICTDGQEYKQLYKAGGDDLRQDAIMEQVFEEVSTLLKSHTATRQRNLNIRTYKVLPLSGSTGALEFVRNTLPLHDVLVPAHEIYYPKDMRHNKCREAVSKAARDSNEHRVKAYKVVTDRFHPVMRFFFFEKFAAPGDWFERRLAYTRSMAVMSILGHILGLGDRHLHNILLDQYSGEIVHIDFGVAFEAGRILPVPEVVPFRLTRDLVDGMGYTKTEGVFRRCCEFTLDTLRIELSPLRAQRMQATQSIDQPQAPNQASFVSRKGEEEVGEAGRALTTVEKKLGDALSTAATVSELITQAIDERNLAVLFAGWSAWV